MFRSRHRVQLLTHELTAAARQMNMSTNVRILSPHVFSLTEPNGDRPSLLSPNVLSLNTDDSSVLSVYENGCNRLIQ